MSARGWQSFLGGWQMRIPTPLLFILLFLPSDDGVAADTPVQKAMERPGQSLTHQPRPAPAAPDKQKPDGTDTETPQGRGLDLIGETIEIDGLTYYLGLFQLGAQPGLWLFRDMDGLAVTDGDIALGPFDMVLAQQQALREALQRHTFALATLPGSFARWPDGEVPFSFEGDWFAHEIPDDRRQPIRDAMTIYEALTPVNFRPKTADDQSWVRFARTWDLAVCPNSSTSAVGRVNGPTTVYIQITDCQAGAARSESDIARSALHEIGHALGFKHEHTRSDRDDFIEIDFDCINQNPISAGVAFLGNYNMSSDDYEAIGPYDFESVMHYPSNVRLDEDNNVTCVTLAKLQEHREENDTLGLIGPNSTLSPEDINALYHMYRRNDQTNGEGDGFGHHFLAYDFDGDGYDDLAVSAIGKAGGDGMPGGAVMLYKGTADGYVYWKRLDPPDPETAQQFGAALAAGDFDLNGTQDLAVGAPGTTVNGKANAGAVFIFEISPNLQAPLRRTLTAPDGGEAGDRFGQSLATGRFFKVSQYAGEEHQERRRPHLAIGAPGARPPGIAWRPGYVWFWNERTPEAFGWPDVDAEQIDWAGGFGHLLLVLDIEGFAWMKDSAHDARRTPLLVSARFDDGLDCGRASVYLMAGPTDGSAGIEIVERIANPEAAPVSASLCSMTRTDPVPEDTVVPMADRGFGRSLAVGDFDGNGTVDIAVGNPEAGHTASEAGPGRVYIFTRMNGGAFALSQTLDQTGIGSNEAGDAFGVSLATGDFNGDGLDDLTVGAPGDDIQGARNAGALFLYRGCRPFARRLTNELLNDALFDRLEPLRRGNLLLCGGPLAVWQSLTQPGDTSEAGDFFAHALAATDVDADGDLDLVVGTPGESPGSEPRSGYLHIITSKGGSESDNFASGPGFSQESQSQYF